MLRRGKRFYHFYLGREPGHWLGLLLTLAVIIAVTLLFLAVGRLKGVDLTKLILGLAISFRRVSVAYIISLILGTAIAFLITRSESIENLLLPLFETAQSLPSPAIFPILAILIGRGDVVVIILLIIAMIWPIVFSSIGGVKGMHRSLVEAAEVFGAKGVKGFFSFSLPIILPSIITGSIVAWGEGWDILVAAELLGAQRGIGAYIGETANTGQLTVMAIAIAFLMLVVFLFNKWVWVPLLKRTTKHQI